jgi:hypothetical protein
MINLECEGGAMGRLRPFAVVVPALALSVLVASAALRVHPGTHGNSVRLRSGGPTAPSPSETPPFAVAAVPPPGEVTDAAALSDALAARFPSTFSGVVTTGDSSVDIYALGDPTEIADSARRLTDGHFAITMRAGDHSRQEMLALKLRIESEESALHQRGVDVHGLGIRIEPNGSRVLVLLSPDTPSAEAELRGRYGADTLTILHSGGTVLQ